jgi:hypothetical protein
VNEEDNYLERSLVELGPPLAEFSVSPWRFWTRLSIGIILLIYGVVSNYYWWVVGPQKFNHFSFLLLFGPPGMGFSLLWLVITNRGLNILVYSIGLLRVQRNQVESFPWHEIERIYIKADSGEVVAIYDEQGQLQNCWIEVAVPHFQIWNASITLERTDEQKLKLAPTLANYGALATTVQQQTFSRQWPQLWERFSSGEVLVFGVVGVSLQGITHAGNLLLWSEPATLSISSKQIVLKREGKWSAWAKIDLESTPNAHLLVAFLVLNWGLFKGIKQPQAVPAED